MLMNSKSIATQNWWLGVTEQEISCYVYDKRKNYAAYAWQYAIHV